MRMLLALLAAFLLVAACAQAEPGPKPTPAGKATVAAQTVATPPATPTSPALDPTRPATPPAKAKPAASDNIRVEQPLPGQQVGREFVVAGEARVFEGTVLVRVLGAGGSELFMDFTTATVAAPEWGRFELPVRLSEPAPAQEVRLEVYTESARDGSVQDLVEVELRFRP